jgi:hypothetical protein
MDEIGSGAGFHFKLLPDDIMTRGPERTANENLACMEVRARQEKNPLDLQNPLGSVGIVASGPGAGCSFDGHDQERGLTHGDPALERTKTSIA